MTKSCRIKDPKTKEYRLYNMSEACLEIARQEKIPGYTYQAKVPKDLDPNINQQVISLKKRLLEKLDGNIDKYASKHKETQIEDLLQIDGYLDEIKFIERLIPLWIQKYLKQNTF